MVAERKKEVERRGRRREETGGDRLSIEESEGIGDQSPKKG
jgi:hypothetical protein